MKITERRARGVRMLVNTQTPLVRFRDQAATLSGPVRLEDLEEGTDYKMTTGGVTRMLLPLLKRWLAQGVVSDVEWVALSASDASPTLTHQGVPLSFVGMPEEVRKGYATVKERMWALLNSNPSTEAPHGEKGIAEEAWVAFDRHQELSAEAMLRAAGRMGGVDLLYVHDFQQIGVAEAWRGPDVPKVFHLHTPFPSVLPSGWADYFVAKLRRYDAVIVSTRRYADNLRAAGLDTPIHVVPPFIDPRDFRPPAPDGVAAFRARFDIAPDDRVVLNVGRMDPMKGQDRLVLAMPRILSKVPNARLVLVGNGSFSSSKNGGLGLDKGREWRESLEALVKDLGIGDRVTFTGHLGDDLLAAAYAACEVFSLPSTREGFGLAAVEAWRHRKPIVVCDRAGVSDIVTDGVDGRVVDCAKPEALADALLDVLARGRDAQARMGALGRAASEVATLDSGARTLEAIFGSVLRERAYATR